MVIRVKTEAGFKTSRENLVVESAAISPKFTAFPQRFLDKWVNYPEDYQSS